MKPHQYLQDMATFVKVAKYKSFSKAGEALNLPTSSISRQIAQMEARLKLKLFHRSSRYVELTPVGADYFAQARTVIDSAQEVYAQIQGQVQHMSGQIKVSASITVAHDYLAPFICASSKRYPEVNLVLEASQHNVNIHAEGFDVVLRMAHQPLKDSDLIAKELLHLNSGLYAAPAYIEQFGEINQLTDLEHFAQHHCMTLSEHVHHWTFIKKNTSFSAPQEEHFHDKIKIDIHPKHVLGSMTLLHQAVVHGMGLACLDNHTAFNDVQSGRLLRILPDWQAPTLRMYALTTTRAQSQRVRVFIDELVAYFKINHRQ